MHPQTVSELDVPTEITRPLFASQDFHGVQVDAAVEKIGSVIKVIKLVIAIFEVLDRMPQTCY